MTNNSNPHEPTIKKVEVNNMPQVKNETSKKFEFTECEVLKARQFSNSRIGFDLKINGITIYSMIAFPYKDKKTGETAWGISFPQRKGSDNHYYNEVYFFVDDELRKNLLEQIDKVLGQN